jgi:hypothetical protein
MLFPNAILELSDAKFARIFGVIYDDGGQHEASRACFPHPGDDEYCMAGL